MRRSWRTIVPSRLQKPARNVRVPSPYLSGRLSTVRRSLFFLSMLAACALASCEDKISTLGTPYYGDTVQFRTITRSDSGFLTFTHVSDTFVTVSGQTKNLTIASPILLVGRVKEGTENMES